MMDGGLVDRKKLLRWLTTTGFGLFTLVVLGIFIRQDVIAEKSRNSVEHTHRVRQQIDRIYVRIKDIESAQRGYALTGDSTYLESYLEAVHPTAGKRSLSLWGELRTLRELVSDNPAQGARAESLGVLVQRRMDYATRVVRLRDSQGVDAVVALSKEGEGKRIMDATREVAQAMLAEEERLLGLRRNAEVGDLRTNRWLLYTVVVLFYLAWILTLRIAARARKRRLSAERELRESNNLLQATIHSGSHAIFATDLDGKVVLMNAVAENMLGYPAGDVVGRKASEALRDIHDREQLERRRKRLEARLKRSVQGMEIFTTPPAPGETPDPEWNMRRRDGEAFLASIVVSPLRGRDGVQNGYLTILRDVTVRRTMERRLAEAGARLNAVINATDYAIFVADAAGVLKIVNTGAERMIGYRAKHLVGKDVLEVTQKIFLPKELAARAERIVKQYGRPPEGVEIFSLPLADDGPLGQEWTNVRADGSRFTAAVSVWELRGEDGSYQGTMAMARDITEIKAVERLKNEFISTVSHELRTPLTSIRGALGLVAGGAVGQLPEGAREMIAIAHRNSERLVHIINDILDIDKIESGRMTLFPRSLDARAALTQAVEANWTYGDKYGVRFAVGSVPVDSWVSADPERFMQVMANLLSNAAKFSPAGGEVIVSGERRGEVLRVSVTDQGPGIPESFRHRIFEKFAQAEGNDARRHDGTGLGLNITKQLVGAMNGTIGFESEEGKGATFWFELPLAALPASGEEERREAGAGERILICEDDADVGKLLRLLLERAGLQAEVVSTLAETRKRLKAGGYAAMTLDLALPDGSGLTLLRELRADPATQSLPVIVVSARAEEGRHELNGDAVGIIDWIPKPIDEGLLAAALRRAVRGGESPRVLHVEDDADFRKILASSLHDAADWSGAATLREAESLLNGGRFDLVVLDLDLPDGSGLALLERLKNAPGGPVPVLILSASETDNGVRQLVEAALVKSRLSEKRIVETILAQIRKAPAGPRSPRTEGTNPA